MKNSLVKIIVAVVILGALGYFFYQKSKDKESVVSSAINVGDTSDTTSNEFSASKFQKIPREQLYDRTPQSNQIVEELKQRFATNFVAFVKEAKATNAKVIFWWSTTEPTIPMNKIGRPFIENLCKVNGVDFVDFVPFIINKKPEEITFMPVDGHFNENGARIEATEMAKYIKRYTDAKSTTTYDSRPKLFGDYEPNQNTILDGDKNLPYKLITNSQGLRMEYDLTFPKTKQRVIMIGDSGFEFPFLDNPKTGSGQLQTMFPDKEIINAAKLGYSIDDYLSLWNEKAKYTEPDIIFLQASGDDIADLFFSHRLRYSRKAENIKPTESELSYYKIIK